MRRSVQARSSSLRMTAVITTLPLRTCRDCGALRPARAFLPIARTPYVYGRCPMCRNRRKKERYYSTLEILAAERARSRRYKQLRKQRAVSDGNVVDR